MTQITFIMLHLRKIYWSILMSKFWGLLKNITLRNTPFFSDPRTFYSLDFSFIIFDILV